MRGCRGARSELDAFKHQELCNSEPECERAGGPNATEKKVRGQRFEDRAHPNKLRIQIS
jgi:hypothetical protein